MHICSGFLNMHAIAARPDHERLFELAEGQQGYFTAAQAVESGFGRSTHSYHVHSGNWVREHRGIYRLRRFPQSADGQLVLWSLWSRDRNGVPQGVYSHLTALSIKELSDANPTKLHMTVPPRFRRGSDEPAILVLHKAPLSADEILQERGYAVTIPLRAILDAAESGAASRDMIQQAITGGRTRGLITRRQITAALEKPNLDPWLRKALQAA
jgi:Transcriptional regulator, AbiEi antitoxin